VATPADTNEHGIVRAPTAALRREPAHGVRALESRNTPFETTQQLESFQCFVIGNGHVPRAADVVQMRVLGPDPRVIQPGRDRVRRMHLSSGVLQQITECAVQYAWRAFRERRGVMLRVEPLSGRLYSDELNSRIVNKSVED